VEVEKLIEKAKSLQKNHHFLQQSFAFGPSPGNLVLKAGSIIDHRMRRSGFRITSFLSLFFSKFFGVWG